MKRLFFLALASLSGVTPAFAQLDYAVFSTWQEGREVGRVYVPVADPCHYIEYWFFYADYAYPTARNRLSLGVTPTPEIAYDSPERFAAAMLREHPDGRLITSEAVEHRAECR